MAYETGTASSMADLVTALFTFATSNGWTQDQLNTGIGEAAMHSGTVYVSFRWNTSTPLHLAIYHALGYSGGSSPGNHTDDSGNGIVSSVNTSLAESRALYNIGNGPYTSYHFFLDTNYLHVVLEYSPGLFRHCGFGELEKFGDWTGGEYCYGHTHINTSPVTAANTCSLDGIFAATTGNQENEGATIHVEGLPGMTGAQKWGICWGSTVSGFTNDRAGNPKVRTPGGFRGNMLTPSFGWLRSNLNNGFIPMIPIPAWYWRTSTSPEELYLLGMLPDVRMINIDAFVPKEEVVVGADTWMVFPTVRKQFTGATDESRNQGIAYKKVA